MTIVLDIVGYYTFKIRSDMMRELQAGNTSNWNTKEDSKIWEEDFIIISLPVAEDGFIFKELDNMEKSNDKGDRKKTTTV